jgi:hypothetical protein
LSTFQILGISLSSAFSLFVVLAIARKRLRPLPGLGWLLLWVAAAIAIANPELTVVLAQSLGIQRGADLIFYLAILGMFAGFFLVYVRLRRLDEGMTTLVRRLAIAEARTPEPTESGNRSEAAAASHGDEGEATE